METLKLVFRQIISIWTRSQTFKKWWPKEFRIWSLSKTNSATLDLRSAVWVCYHRGQAQQFTRPNLTKHTIKLNSVSLNKTNTSEVDLHMQLSKLRNCFKTTPQANTARQSLKYVHIPLQRLPNDLFVLQTKRVAASPVSESAMWTFLANSTNL
jgi:hypothetical protein